MQLSRRRLGPDEIDHELLWLSVSLGSFALAAFWMSLGLPWPHCTFHDLTGLPCLTCGATRAAIQFFHGNFVRALEWNPLAFAGLCAVSVFNIYAACVLVTRAPRLRIARLKSSEKNLVRALLISALLLNWCYLLGHWKKCSDALEGGDFRRQLLNSDGQNGRPTVSGVAFHGGRRRLLQNQFNLFH